MKKNIFILLSILIFGPLMIYADTTAEVQIDILSSFQKELLNTIFYFLIGLFFSGVSALFAYMAVKFPKLAKYFKEFKNIAEMEISRTEEKRNTLPDILTAKQGVELKNETTERILKSKVSQELRRGVINIFGIFGGKSKNLGKELFDNMVPGFIDNQVFKFKSK